MKNLSSLNEEINMMMQKKLYICECDPCTCSEQKKEIYFQELKEILAKFNEEHLGSNLARLSYLNQSISKNNY